MDSTCWNSLWSVEVIPLRSVVMRIKEDFTRCKCGEALIEKKEYITATYQFHEEPIPTSRRIQYRCKGCNHLIHEHILPAD